MQVAPIRPILFAQDSVIFELRDGRVRSYYHFHFRNSESQ